MLLLVALFSSARWLQLTVPGARGEKPHPTPARPSARSAVGGAAFSAQWRVKSFPPGPDFLLPWCFHNEVALGGAAEALETPPPPEAQEWE